MRKRLALSLALLLLCTGCTQTAEGPTPTQESAAPMPTPEATPAPSPKPLETVEALLAEIEVGLAQDSYSLRGWMDPGSGPSPYTLYASACGEALRELLTSVDWQVGAGLEKETWHEWEYSVDLFFAQPGLLLRFQPHSNTVYCYRQDWYYDGCGAFHAEEVHDLCAQLLKLWPSPLLRYQLVGVPTTGDWQEEARAYAKAFEEDYLASGHITDFHLDALELTEWEGNGEEGHFITLNYSVVPANPDDPAWEDSKACIDEPEFTGDGRIRYSQRLGLVPMEDGYTRPRCPY